VTYSQLMPTETAGHAALPVTEVTADQIAAINIRYWRRKAGLTQEELGERIGWTGANVSAAERSADPANDKRRFDAHTLLAFAGALGVPIAALLMPPDDEGISGRYVLAPGGAGVREMRELASFVFSEPTGDDTETMNAYRVRYWAMAQAYTDAKRGEQLAAVLGNLSTEQQRAERAARLAWQRQALVGLVADIDQMTEAIISGGDAE